MTRWPAVALVLLAEPLAAQHLADRVAAAPDGTVRFSFAARHTVCGDGHTIIGLDCVGGRCGGSTILVGSWRGRGEAGEGDEVEYDCDHGPVRVSVSVRKGSVAALRTYVGGRWRTPPGPDVTDLGTVAAAEATDFLLALAARSQDRVGEEAILPAVLADSVTVWPALLKLARDERLPRRTRRQAIFWVGQAAGDVATRGLAAVVDDEALERDVKEQAVFALSQEPHGEGVTALIHIARSNPDREVRRKALFWLGQSNDSRALALFEELLTKP